MFKSGDKIGSSMRSRVPFVGNWLGLTGSLNLSASPVIITRLGKLGALNS